MTWAAFILASGNAAGASFYDADAHAGDMDLSALDERLAQQPTLHRQEALWIQ